MKPLVLLCLATTILALGLPFATGDDAPATAGQLPAPNRSTPGHNDWNAAHEPADWWQEIKQAHGHVGPWNVLGWRMGKAALRELKSTWGQHELDIVCHVPLKTPFSCLADGLVVGTGNSIGRLDIRLAEALAVSDIHVSVRRQDGTGPVLLLKPSLKYLDKIRRRPAAQLEALAHECGDIPEADLFEVSKVPAPDAGAKSGAP
jgi:formylmethanofuran dehydrogenase subunit E